MLVTIALHQPRMLLSILEGTPTWVWGLFVALVALGASQLRTRSVALSRTLLMPVAMTGFAGWGVLSAFGGSSAAGWVVVAWLGTAAVALALLWGWTRRPAAGVYYDAAARRFHVPGSVLPLLLIVAVFLTKYVVGVESALQPALTHDSQFALTVAAIYGGFTGFFLARGLRMWRLALGGSAPALRTA